MLAYLRHKAKYKSVLEILREGRLGDGYFDHGDDMKTLERKFSECSPAFIDDILENGILTPIRFEDGVLKDGHHRFAVAVFSMMEEVPVTHDFRKSHNPNFRHSSL